jgi:hypothetical protein
VSRQHDRPDPRPSSGLASAALKRDYQGVTLLVTRKTPLTLCQAVKVYLIKLSVTLWNKIFIPTVKNRLHARKNGITTRLPFAVRKGYFIRRREKRESPKLPTIHHSFNTVLFVHIDNHTSVKNSHVPGTSILPPDNLRVDHIAVDSAPDAKTLDPSPVNQILNSTLDCARVTAE